MENTPRQVILALERLRAERDPRRREDVLKAGLTEMIRWFTLAAKIILQKKIQLPKQTQTLMDKHKETLQRLSDEQVPLQEKQKLILKPGGSGFLGGVMIRSLLRWDGKKTIRKFVKNPRKTQARRGRPKGTKGRPKTSPPKKRRLVKKNAKKNRWVLDDRFITQRRSRRLQGAPVLSPHLPSPRNSPVPIPSLSSPSSIPVLSPRQSHPNSPRSPSGASPKSKETCTPPRPEKSGSMDRSVSSRQSSHPYSTPSRRLSSLSSSSSCRSSTPSNSSWLSRSSSSGSGSSGSSSSSSKRSVSMSPRVLQFSPLRAPHAYLPGHPVFGQSGLPMSSASRIALQSLRHQMGI